MFNIEQKEEERAGEGGNTRFWTHEFGNALIARQQLFIGGECVHDSKRDEELDELWRELTLPKEKIECEKKPLTQDKQSRKGEQKAQQKQNQRNLRKFQRNQKR